MGMSGTDVVVGHHRWWLEGLVVGGGNVVVAMSVASSTGGAGQDQALVLQDDGTSADCTQQHKARLCLFVWGPCLFLEHVAAVGGIGTIAS